MVDATSVHPDGDTGRDPHPLDCRTQLSPPDRGWSVKMLPEVGEAVVYWDREPSGDGSSRWSRMSERERQELNDQRRLTRARGAVRRYAVRNKLTRMVTLTYRCQMCHGDPCTCGQMQGPSSRAAVKRDVNRFLVALRAVLRVDAVPYLYVIERGTRSTKRLHVHLAVSREVSAELVADTWEHGRVDVADRDQVDGVRARARAMAKYLAKYLAKSLGDEDPAWAHSYERSQGFNVREVKRRRLGDLAEVWTLLAIVMGHPSELQVQWSDEWEDWYGPPLAVIWAP